MDESLSEIYERIQERISRLPRRDEGPRLKCHFCGDRAVEYYVHPEHPFRPYIRPCRHCDAGQDLIQLWMNKGPWRGLDHESVQVIMERPCEHDHVEG